VLKEHGQDEDEAVLYLSSLSNLHEVRKRLALKYQAVEESANAPIPPPKIVGREKKVSHDDADYIEAEYVEDGRIIPIRTLHPSIEQYEGQIRIHYRKRKLEKLRKNRDSRSAPKPARPARLKLDEALASMDFSEWSEARRRAWQIKDKNPNAYYYRFNDPGEAQRNGKWTKDERVLFFNRMEEIGVDGKWGIFSKAIPGRVGYQCSNFYRHLIENKEIKDKNYILDEKGKAHYLFQKGICQKRKKNGEDPANMDKPILVKKQKQKSKKKKRSDEDDEGDDEEYIPSGSMELEQKKR